MPVECTCGSPDRRWRSRITCASSVPTGSRPCGPSATPGTTRSGRSGASARRAHFQGGTGDVVLDATKYGSDLTQWLDTGIVVDPGMRLVISGDGQVDLWPQGPGQYVATPKGYNTAGKGGTFMAGSLVGRVGENGRVFPIGDRYEGTPHNVGQHAVMLLAEQLGQPWSTEGEVRLCRVERGGATVYLVQPLVAMNHVGGVLARLGQRLALAPERCILVHDDLHLPVGKIRTRMNGSHGGHRGVRSVLETFQDDTFPRVKIGVGRPAPGQTVTDYVLTPVAADQRPVVDRACRDAASRALEMIALLTSRSTKGWGLWQM